MDVTVLRVNTGFGDDLNFWGEVWAALDAMPGCDLRSAVESLVDTERVIVRSDLADRMVNLFGMIPSWVSGPDGPVHTLTYGSIDHAIAHLGDDSVLRWSMVDGSSGHFVGHWDPEVEAYVVNKELWFSEDGRQWTDSKGLDVKSRKLQRSWVWLVSGPLDGAIFF